jgi:hypothetical protein
VKKNGAMTMKTLEGLLKLKDIEGSGKVCAHIRVLGAV